MLPAEQICPGGSYSGCSSVVVSVKNLSLEIEGVVSSTLEFRMISSKIFLLQDLLDNSL